MKEKKHALLAPLVASGLALSGCVSSPTYGTDKTANEQLVGDLSSAFSLAPQKRPQIDYKPRPALVKPAPGEKEMLPPPQDDITQTASADWPESPEQKRARLRAEADAHFNDPSYQSQIVADDVNTDPAAVKKMLAEAGSSHPPRWSPEDSALGTDARRKLIAKRLQESQQGDPTKRKYLSEPPLDYRVAASTAPQNDIGEDEWKKQEELKRKAKGGKSSLWDWLPSW
jgi:hypothetical protein